MEEQEEEDRLGERRLIDREINQGVPPVEPSLSALRLVVMEC